MQTRAMLHAHTVVMLSSEPLVVNVPAVLRSVLTRNSNWPDANA